MYVTPTLPTIEPWFVSAKPWMLQSERQFLPGRPVDLNSATWAHDFNETKTLGAKNSTTRTSQQTLMARFWAATGDWPVRAVRAIARERAAANRELRREAGKARAIVLG
jgi:hypothetical protein